MKLIDTHTHLYLEEFDADREAVLQEALDAGVTRFLLPNIDIASIAPLYRLCDAHPGNCHPMMGLHPCSVKDDYKAQLSLIESEFGRRAFVAVGEIGIDLYWDKTTLKQQTDAFMTQIRWAHEAGLPVSIHSRDATGVILDLLRGNEGKNPGGVFHCFTGTAEEAGEVLRLGFHLGVGGVVTFRNAGLDKTLAGLPPDRMVLETDAPYLAPAPHRGKRNVPAYLALVARKLAEAMSSTPERIAASTSNAAMAVFSRIPRD